MVILANFRLALTAANGAGHLQGPLSAILLFTASGVQQHFFDPTDEQTLATKT